MFGNWKRILALAIPSIFSFATATLTGTINLIIVGALGAVVIAVVGVTNIIMYNAWALFSGFGNTVNYLVAQSYGAGNYGQAVRRALVALAVCLPFAALVLAAGMLGSEWLLWLVTGSREMADAGETYVRLRFLALVIGVFSYVFHGFFRGIGDTRTPAALTLIGCAVMVWLTYALTYGRLGFPELGLTGAGWAFLAGEAVGLAGCVAMFFIKLRHRFGIRAGAGFSRAESRLILLESGKLGIQEFAMSLSMFLFTMFVGRLGAVALAVSSLTEHPLVVLAAVLGGVIVSGVLAAIPALSWLQPYLLTTGWSAGADVLRDPLPLDGLGESTLRALCYLVVGAGVTVARMLRRDA